MLLPTSHFQLPWFNVQRWLSTGFFLWLAGNPNGVFQLTSHLVVSPLCFDFPLLTFSFLTSDFQLLLISQFWHLSFDVLFPTSFSHFCLPISNFLFPTSYWYPSSTQQDLTSRPSSLTIRKMLIPCFSIFMYYFPLPTTHLIKLPTFMTFDFQLLPSDCLLLYKLPFRTCHFLFPISYLSLPASHLMVYSFIHTFILRIVAVVCRQNWEVRNRKRELSSEK